MNQTHCMPYSSEPGTAAMAPWKSIPTGVVVARHHIHWLINTKGCIFRKAAVIVSYIDAQILADVCESMRKYTRKRMHFIKYLLMYRMDQGSPSCELALVIVTNSNEASSRVKWLKKGFTEATFSQEPGQQMMCEGETTYITIENTLIQRVPISFFSKQKCSQVMQCSLSSDQRIQFCLSNQNNEIIGRGGILYVDMKANETPFENWCISSLLNMRRNHIIESMGTANLKLLNSDLSAQHYCVIIIL